MIAYELIGPRRIAARIRGEGTCCTRQLARLLIGAQYRSVTSEHEDPFLPPMLFAPFARRWFRAPKDTSPSPLHLSYKFTIGAANSNAICLCRYRHHHVSSPCPGQRARAQIVLTHLGLQAAIASPRKKPPYQSVGSPKAVPVCYALYLEAAVHCRCIGCRARHDLNCTNACDVRLQHMQGPAHEM